MKFKEFSFKDLLVDIVDNRGRTCPTAETGIPLIATNCIKNDGLYPAFEKLRYVDQDTYDNWFRGHPKPGDMVFVCKGSPGQVCWVPDPINFCIAQDMVAIRADESKVYPKYLFSLLRAEETQQKILNMHVGTLIPHFKKGDFGNLYLDIPEDYEYQKVVGDAYFAFCEKIELNRQINRTLEEIAQAIFKSWFVDFDPVKAKMIIREKGGSEKAQAFAAQAFIAGNVTLEALESMEAGYSGWEEMLHPLVVKNFEPMGLDQWEPEQLAATAALFPSTLTDSPLGPIPEGWATCDLGDELEVLETGSRPKGGVRGINEGIPSVGAENINGIGNYAYGKEKFVSIDFFKKMKRGIVKDFDFLLYKDGGKPGDFRPRVSMFGCGFPYKEFAINEHVFRIRSESLGQPFLYFQIGHERVLAELRHKGAKAAIPGINQSDVRSIMVVKPDCPDLLKSFNNFVGTMMESILRRSSENLALSNLRDELLPKLLSGEISVGEAEAELEEAA